MHKIKSEEDHHSQPHNVRDRLGNIADSGGAPARARVAEPPLHYTFRPFPLSIPTIVYRKELQNVSIQLTFSHYMLYLPARSSVQ